MCLTQDFSVSFPSWGDLHVDTTAWITSQALNPLHPMHMCRFNHVATGEIIEKWRFRTMFSHCIKSCKLPELKHCMVVWLSLVLKNLLYPESSHTSRQWSPNKIQRWKCGHSLCIRKLTTHYTKLWHWLRLWQRLWQRLKWKIEHLRQSFTITCRRLKICRNLKRVLSSVWVSAGFAPHQVYTCGGCYWSWVTTFSR